MFAGCKTPTTNHLQRMKVNLNQPRSDLNSLVKIYKKQAGVHYVCIIVGVSLGLFLCVWAVLCVFVCVFLLFFFTRVVLLFACVEPEGFTL